MSSTQRLFIAIELDAALCAALLRIIRKLRHHPSARHIHWTAPEKLHLTLRFLGATSTDRIAALSSAISTLTRELTPFIITFDHLIALPAKHPHVVALTALLSPELIYTAQALERSLLTEQIEPEQRPFLPHITLGRVKERTNLKELLALPTPPLPNLYVRHITLLRSVTLPAGSVYTVIKRMGFGDFSVE